MPTLASSRGNIYFEVHGKGPPVLALHDGAGSTRALKWQVSELAEHFTLVLYDRLGHGRSEELPGYEKAHFEQRAGELGELIAHLGLDVVHLLGICEGGAVALVYATSWPEQVVSLICQGVGYHTSDHTGSACEQYFRPWPGLDPLLQKRLCLYHGRDYARLKWEALREAKHYVWDPSYDLRPLLSKIAAPTLIMGGDRDPFFGLEHPITAYRGMRDAELCIVPGAGHFVNEEAPSVFNRIVIDFLKRQISRSREEGNRHEGPPA